MPRSGSRPDARTKCREGSFNEAGAIMPRSGRTVEPAGLTRLTLLQ